MSAQDKREARRHMGRAGRQGKHAVRNAGRAARFGAEAAAEETKDAPSHAAEHVEGAAERVAEDVRVVTPKLSARGLAAISGDTGTGFLALAVSLYSGAIAFHKFRSAIQGRGRAVA
jgi:hypothetical protein